MYATHGLNLKHIALKFHQDIPYSYLLMVPYVQSNNSTKEINSEAEKGRAIFCATPLINLISIAIIMHEDFPYSNLLMVGTISVKSLIKGK